DPHLAAIDVKQCLDARPHFLRGLVRERDGKNAIGCRSSCADEMRDPVRDHTRLARTGAREDEKRTLSLQNSSLLFRIETGEEIHSSLFYRYALCQISWLIHVAAAPYRNVIR